jgi:hypothetical protein
VPNQARGQCFSWCCSSDDSPEVYLVKFGNIKNMWKHKIWSILSYCRQLWRYMLFFLLMIFLKKNRSCKRIIFFENSFCKMEKTHPQKTHWPSYYSSYIIICTGGGDSATYQGLPTLRVIALREVGQDLRPEN